MKSTVPAIKNCTSGGKSLKVLKSQLNYNQVDSEKFNESFESIGSDIKVINGSFSTLKPMHPQEDYTPGPSFQPGITSTPIYENISADEDESQIGDESEAGDESQIGDESKKMEDALDITFDEDTFIARETESCDLYLSELTKFISKTDEMMREKKIVRAGLHKRLLKYKKKIIAIEKAITNLNRMVKFGERVPSLLEDL